MKNLTIKELLENLSKGKISKDDFFLLLKTMEKDKNSPEIDQAFQELFNGFIPDKTDQSTPIKPKDNSD